MKEALEIDNAKMRIEHLRGLMKARQEDYKTFGKMPEDTEQDRKILEEIDLLTKKVTNPT